MLIQYPVNVFQWVFCIKIWWAQVGTLSDFATLLKHNTTKRLPTPILVHHMLSQSQVYVWGYSFSQIWYNKYWCLSLYICDSFSSCNVGVLRLSKECARSFFTYFNCSEPLHMKLELCRVETAYSHCVLLLPLHFLST